MLYDISNYFGWIAAAFLLGAVIGWLTFEGPHGKWLAGWFRWGAGLFVLGLIVALFHLLPGRFGLYLETALLLFGGYIIGGHVGAWLKSLTAGKSGKASSALGTTVSQPSTSASSLAGKVGAAGAMAGGSAAVAASAAKTATTGVTGAATSAVSDATAGIAAKAGDVAALATGSAAGVMTSATGVTGAATSAVSDATSGIAAKAGDVAALATGSAAGVMTSATGVTGAATSAVSDATTGISAKAGDAAALATGSAAGVMTSATGVAGAATSAVSDATSGIAAKAGDAAALATGSAAGVMTSATGVAGAATSAVSDATSGIAAKAGDAAALATGSAALVAAGVAAKSTPSSAVLPGEAPPALAAPMGGKADDLKLIKGIGPKNEMVLNGLGYHHFSQIAAWTAPQEQWIGHKMAFPGRIEREHWVPQAKSLAAGIETDHARAVKAGLKVEDSAEDHAAAAATGGLATVSFLHDKATASSKPGLFYGENPAVVASDAHLPGTAPASRVHADDGRGDDLTQIKGIGAVNQTVLNGLGVHHFHQIAAWTPDNAMWMGHKMAFPGRIEREEWVPQARQLALGRPDTKAMAADPAAAPALPDEGAHEGRRPPGFVGPRGGKADDLKRIRGIGRQNEERLHGLGIWHFDQISAWNHDQVRWVGSYLAFPGRIDREEWVSQAKVLASGRETEFSKRVEAGEVASSLPEGEHKHPH